MAKDKDRAINPAAAQRKADKQRALKKGKAAVAAQRNERLAHRNPDKLQIQVDELKARQSADGQLSQRDQTLLTGLERDVDRIRKARQTIGKPLATGRHNEQQLSRSVESHAQILGKRPRPTSHRNQQNSPPSSDTDEDVRDIPMPKDTPPPLPRKRMDTQHRNDLEQSKPVSENQMPALHAPAQLTYESKPVVRDLKKEATAFVPKVVKQKLDAVRGGVQQTLLDEDELDRLEKEGYGLSTPALSMPPNGLPANRVITSVTQGIAAQPHAWVEDACEDNGG